jgi:large subunit ribosomal protein L13
MVVFTARLPLFRAFFLPEIRVQGGTGQTGLDRDIPADGVFSLVSLPRIQYHSASFFDLFESLGTFSMKTFSAKTETVKRDWYVVDADNKVLGRLATEIARRLRGKHKTEYTPHVDTGDYIVVINAEKVAVTGNKETAKMYHHHTGYPGGLKSISLDKQRSNAPERIIEAAVRGMLPKNSLGRAMFRKLKVYAGPEHNHSAQQPKPLEL